MIQIPFKLQNDARCKKHLMEFYRTVSQGTQSERTGIQNYNVLYG